MSLYVTTQATHWYTPVAHLGIKTRSGAYDTRCRVSHKRMKRVTLREFRRQPCAICLAVAATAMLKKRGLR
jgi:hypothetical protein